MKWLVTGALLLRRWGKDKRWEASKKIALAAGVAAITAVELSHAATITYASVNNGSTVVYVVGPFEYGDENKFAQVTAPLSRVFVSFHSQGGNAYAGIQIGKIIHGRGYTTYVGAGAVCASACAVAWLGGSRRTASARARIAFHAVYTGTGSDAHETGSGNAMLGAYLNEIGLSSDRAIYYLTHGPDYGAELWARLRALCTLWGATGAAASLCATARRIWTGPRLSGASVEYATRANDAALRSAASGLPVWAIGGNMRESR